MSGLRLVHEVRDQRHLLFAVRDTGEPVWARDEATGQEWWYVAAGVERLRPLVDQALASEGRSVLLAAPSDDLSRQQPGHAVLAKIEQLHLAAVDVDGMPGVLDDAVTAWCLGYVGEERVGARLAGLPPGWHVLHAVPVGATADIDHVVIGPPGVVVVNTKHHQGASITVGTHVVFVAGQQKSYLRDIRRDAASAVTALRPQELPVHQVICVVGARRIRRSDAAADVVVVDEHLLVSCLTSLPAVASPAEAEQAYDRLRRASSWTDHPPVPAAAPWVGEYARGMATEERIVKTQRRVKAPHEPRTTRRRPTRSSSRWFALLKVLLVLAAMFGLLLALPLIVRLASQGATTLLPTPSTPSTAATPTAGAACTTKGERVTASGTTFVCTRKGSSAPLQWQPTRR